MDATDFTRYGCKVGNKTVTYIHLCRYYVCNKCGGRLARRCNATDDWAECVECHNDKDFIHESQFERECFEAFEVERGLPPELRALVGDSEPMVSAQQAIDELYG